MTCRNLAALLVLLACGCGQSSAPDSGPAADASAPAVQISIPDSPTEGEGGQTADADAGDNLTLVSLHVPGMT